MSPIFDPLNLNSTEFVVEMEEVYFQTFFFRNKHQIHYQPTQSVNYFVKPPQPADFRAVKLARFKICKLIVSLTELRTGNNNLK